MIHATPRRLILATNKETIVDAIGYVDFIEKTLVQKEYFQAIDFKFASAWHVLLWHNANNHGGIQMSEALIRKTLGELDEQDDEEQESEIVLKFEWQEHLPEEARIKESFTQVRFFVKNNYRSETLNRKQNAPYRIIRRLCFSQISLSVYEVFVERCIISRE